MEIGDKKWIETVVKGSAELGITLSEFQTELLTLHCKELIAWNKITNLTAITDPEEIAVKHVIDSLAASIMIPDGAKVIDIGTGGGFPGIPLKIIRNDLEILLLDSSRKKISFLKQVIIKSKLKGIRAVHSRAEDLAEAQGITKSFDIAICRAFSSLDNIFTLATPFLKDDGCILAMKGREATNEMESFVNANERNAMIQVKEYSLPFINQDRAILRIAPGFKKQ